MTANAVPDKPIALQPLRRRTMLANTLALVFALAAPAGLAATPDAPSDSITRHQFSVGGQSVPFTVTAATTPINDGDARIFHVAYTRDEANVERRPITFVFNGGPGASSAYLHLAALGPRIVPFGADGRLPEASAGLVDNPDHWLDLTDLVFVDPVGTGYSRAGGDGQRYWGVAEDLETMAAFIDAYLTAAGRRDSPKYLVGESYGGFRAARVPRLLARRYGIGIAGLFLVSPVLEFSLISTDPLALLPEVLRLPSYAAVRLELSGTPTAEALAEVERFALGPYLAALAATPRDPAALAALYPELARHTGVAQSVIAEHQGHIPVAIFQREARRPDNLVISRYDGSATSEAGAKPGESRGDALFDGLRAVLAKSMTGYLADELGLHTDLPYTLQNNQAFRTWNWSIGRHHGYAGAADALDDLLKRNPEAKVVIAHGMTDLVTPYMTSRFVIDRLPPTHTAGRVTLSLLPGGHMMYLRPGSRAGLHEAAAKLYPAP